MLTSSASVRFCDTADSLLSVLSLNRDSFVNFSTSAGFLLTFSIELDYFSILVAFLLSCSSWVASDFSCDTTGVVYYAASVDSEAYSFACWL